MMRSRTDTNVRRGPRQRPSPVRRGPWLLAGALLYVLAAVAEAEPVRIAGVSHLGDLPTYVAEDEGLFARAGIEARVSRVPDGRIALQRLRTGAADFALTALTPLVLDRLADRSPSGDDDPVILASLVQSTRLNQIVTLTDRDIRDPADLAGRRLGLTLGTNAEFHWWLFATFHGIDPAAVEVVDIARDALDDALASGRIDAAVLWQPWTARLRTRVGGRMHTLASPPLYTAHWVLVTRRSTAENRPRRSSAVVQAYLHATEAIEREPGPTFAGFRQHLGLARDVAPPEDYPYGYQIHLDWSVLMALGEQFDWASATSRGKAAVPAPSILAMLAPGPLHDAAPDAVNVAAELLEAEPTP